MGTNVRFAYRLIGGSCVIFECSMLMGWHGLGLGIGVVMIAYSLDKGS